MTSGTARAGMVGTINSGPLVAGSATALMDLP